MPRSLAQYDVFIGSPGGLEAERRAFRSRITRFNETYAIPQGVMFRAVGWEDTLGGVGRPQEIINGELRGCDHAIFVLFDRWGTPTGTNTSGTKEEFEIAETLYASASMRSICVFFKEIPDAQLKDPGKSLKKVLDFKGEMERSRKYLYHTFDTTDGFDDLLEKHLARWLAQHLGGHTDKVQPSESPVPDTNEGEPFAADDFTMLLTNATSAYESSGEQGAIAAKFLANKALGFAKSDQQRYRSLAIVMLSNAALRNYGEALTAYDAMSAQQVDISTATRLQLSLSRLDILRKLGRIGDIEQIFSSEYFIHRDTSEDDIADGIVSAAMIMAAAYDQNGQHEKEIDFYELAIGVACRFPDNEELRFSHSKALYNLGVTIRGKEDYSQAILRLEEALARLPQSDAVTHGRLRVAIKKAMASSLVSLNRYDEAWLIYDEMIEEYRGSSDRDILLTLSNSIILMGIDLEGVEDLPRSIDAYDLVVSLFGDNKEVSFVRNVASALRFKASALYRSGRIDEEISVHDQIFSRYAENDDPEIQTIVAASLWSKSVSLRIFNRDHEIIDCCNLMISLFAQSEIQEIRSKVAALFVNRGIAQSNLGVVVDQLEGYDQCISIFGASNDEEVKNSVLKVRIFRAMHLGTSGKKDEAILACDEIVALHTRDPNPIVASGVIEAIVFKAVLVESIHGKEEYAQIIALFDKALAHQEAVVHAEMNDARSKACLRKAQAQARMDNVTGAAVTYGLLVDQNLNKVSDAIVFEALLGLAAIAKTQNSPEEEMKYLALALAQSGLEDSDFSRAIGRAKRRIRTLRSKKS